MHLKYGAQKTTSTNQKLSHLWQTICLAQKMGEGLGRSKILQRQVQKKFEKARRC
jgi:hypothetical protein